MTFRAPGYEVERELGRGGMGVVLLARELATDRRVAIKVALEASPEQLLRFGREGELLARLDHPGIVRVHAARVAERRPYLVVELVEGARSVVDAAAPLPPPVRARLVRDAARALGHAHARGVVHRDVKPDNLLVDQDGRVRVADFGVALATDLERLTRTSELVGTPAYMAPEQLAGRAAPVTPATDVWALGAVLFRLLTGRPPFDGATLVALMAQVTGGRAPRARAVAAHVPPALDEVVARALEPDPAARYPDGEAMAAALDQALGQEPSRDTGRGPLPPLLAAGAAGLGLVVLLLRAGPPPPAPVSPPRPTSTAPVVTPLAPASPAPVASWLDALRRSSDASERLRALEAFDADPSPGDPGQRAAAARRLREALAARQPAPERPFDLEAYDHLLWSHALLCRLDPSHRPSPEDVAALKDITFLRPAAQGRGLAARGLELARILPDRLEGPLLHADGCSALPAAADGEVLRAGLALASAKLAAGAGTSDEEPEGAWLRLAEIHAGWLAAHAAVDPSLRPELAALAEAAERRLGSTPDAASRILALAARHAPAARARQLLRAATERGASTADDQLARAWAWNALSQVEGRETPEGAQARGTAVLQALAAVESIVVEEPPQAARLERAGAVVALVVAPGLGFSTLERLLKRAPTSALPGLAVRLTLALAETGGSEDRVGAALALVVVHLEAWRRSAHPPRDLAWIDEGLLLARRLAARTEGRGAATREQLAPWWARRRVGIVQD